MSDDQPVYGVWCDTRFVISMMPDDLRNEIAEILAQNPENVEALWWRGAGDEEYKQLAYAMMNDDYLWNVWRECFQSSMVEEMKHCKASRLLHRAKESDNA